MERIATNALAADPGAEPANRRAAERFALSLPVRIGLDDGTPREATLIDLSSGGFRARGALDAGRGTRLWVRLAGRMPVGARLVWSNEGVSGGAFDAPLPPSQVRRLLEAGRIEAAPAPERPPGLTDLLRRTRDARIEEG